MMCLPFLLKQKKKYPNNTYLTISEDNAWKLLYELSNISLQILDMSNDFIEYGNLSK